MKDEVIALIRAQIDIAHIDVEMQGNHCHITIVSSDFDGQSRVVRQQTVYACLEDKIASGEIHAVHIRAISPEQWSA